MASMYQAGAALRDVRALFDSGTAVGLSDGELLGRLADRPDAAGPALAALVERHGPMVWRVCRAALRHEQDAEDAFQATFLVLVRRAGSVRRRESIGSWLHGVALRVSARARADLARRRRHERRAGEGRAAEDLSEAGGISSEHVAIVHEELGRLPVRYRAAVVLCDLEGQTCEAAARHLGWPVGTVKSRLARGRERLRGRLARRGLGPDEASVVPAVSLPAALPRATVEAMLRFVAGGPTAAAISPAALSWTLRTLRTTRMTRLALLSILLFVGLAATVAATRATQGRAPSGPAATTTPAIRRPDPAPPAASGQKVNTLSVRVIDTRGRGVPGVALKVVESDRRPTYDGPGSLTAAYRTGADGRVGISVDPLYKRLDLESRPDDRTFAWARFRSDQGWPKASDEDPIVLTLLPRSHTVEGTIVDARGKPIGGVQVRAVQFDHPANGFATDYGGGGTAPSLVSAVTDDAGRYRLALPEATTVIFQAYHPRYVGPTFSCKPEDRAIKAVALGDAGGIAGTVIDAATGRPVPGVRVAAQSIERDVRIRGGGWGTATSDARGHFLVGGLDPGVYNLRFGGSPKGRRFTAKAVEGVRVKAGAEAGADLRMIVGRRLHGTVIHAETGEPLAGKPIFCYDASYPHSGAACQGTYSDDHGRFEHFVPPGPAFVYIAESGLVGVNHQKALIIPDDRDPEPVVLKRTGNPNARPLPHYVNVARCETRVRVKAGAGDRPAPGAERTLTGRVFKKDGSPLVAVQVQHNSRTLREAATDRLGLFRLKGLPQGELQLGLRIKGSDEHGTATIPADAIEVNLIVP